MFPKIIRVFSIFSIICCIQHSIPVHATTPCDPMRTDYGVVCRCTPSYCDYLENPEPINDNIVVVSSSEEGDRFAVRNLRFTDNKAKPESDSNDVLNLKVDRFVEHQTIAGFGAAITGAVSWLLSLMEQPLQDHLYKSYYHKDGIGFNMLRMPIGGCDFDFGPWAYNEEPQNDPELSSFTELDQRDVAKVEQLKRLKAVSNLDELKIMAAAWSSPTWMKTNGNWSGYGFLKEEYYQAWADYHLRFIELMDAAGMPLWSITTGNEPLNALILSNFIKFMSLGWIAREQAIWVNDYLGPTIRNSKYKDVLIYGNEDRRMTFPSWFYEMNATRPGVLDYIDGFAVHWYYDDYFGPELMDWTAQMYPGKTILNTESGIGNRAWAQTGPQVGSWERGERVIRGFLHNFQHSYQGWINWNLFLDWQGGPKYVPGYSDAAVIVNATNPVEIYKQPFFYAMGHFSKFVPEGSVRIQADIFSTFDTTVDTVAFKRPDGRISVVLLNDDDKTIDVMLNDSEQGEIQISIPPKSWHSIVYS